MKIRAYEKLLKAGVKSLKANSTMATLVLSGTGYILALVEGCRATTKAVKVVEKAKPQTKTETVKLTWRYYLKAAGLVVASTAGLIIVGRNYSKQTKQIAHLVQTLAISDAALKDREEAMRTILGDKKTEEVLDEEARMAVRKPCEEHPVAFTGKGNTLNMIIYTKQRFRMSVHHVKSNLAKVALEYSRHRYISYNDVIDILSECTLEHPGGGDDWFWDYDLSGDDVFTDRVHIASVIDPAYDEPCTTIEFLVPPTVEPRKYKRR